MNMKFLIGVVIISMFILSATTYVSQLQSQYNTTADMTGFNNTRERIDVINADINSTFGGLNKDIDSSSVTTTYEVIKLAWSSVKLTFSNFRLIAWDIPGDIFKLISDQKLLPTGANWLLPSLISIIVASFIIFLVGFLMRYRAG